MASRGETRFWSLQGRVEYEEARELQLRLVELRARDLVPDTLLFLEHEPVITRGRGLQFTGEEGRPRHMPLPGPLPEGVAFAESERGGDLTYHGPGQLVAYPIFKLDGQGFGPARDVGAFLRRFERVFIDEIASLGKGRVVAESREHATGVWVREVAPGAVTGGEQGSAPARKIASMGIAVRRWVTFHGIALNCVNDLRPFFLISPCGYGAEVMTRLCDWTALPEDWDGEGRAFLERRIAARVFGQLGQLGKQDARVESLGLPEALRWVEQIERANPARPAGARGESIAQPEAGA